MSVLANKTNTNLYKYDGTHQNIAPLDQRTVVLPNPQQANNSLQLGDILNILKRRKWSIILPLLLMLSLSILYTLSTPTTYRANAVIQIEKEGAEIVDFGKTSSLSSISTTTFFRSSYEKMKGRVIAKKVINELNLYESLSSTKDSTKNEKSFFSGILGLFGMKDSKPKTTNNVKNYVEMFSKKLLVQPIANTHLVEVFYEGTSPDEAKNVVTSVLSNFIKTQIETKSETGEYAKNFLGKQLETARERLRSSEEELISYANDKGILAVDDQQVRHVKKLENLDTALVQAEIRRIEAESLYQQMKRAGSVSTVLTNPVIANLKARLVTLEGDYQEMLKTFKPNYPDMKRLQQQIGSAKAKLNKEKYNIQRSMEADYLAAKRQENKIRSELSSFNKKMYSLQDNSLDYNRLKREVGTNTNLYNSLLQRFEEVNVASAATTSNISIVEPAVTPLSRYRPKPKLNILLGLFSGLLLGLAYAFLREALDKSIKSTDDLERVSGLPVLGTIPRVIKNSIRKQLPTISKNLPQSPAAEAYRILSTNLRFMSGPENERVLLVTSAHPEEGKSVTATNIAHSYAQMGLKVLLVDADIRKSSLHKKLNISNKLGLSNYLKGEIDLVGITQPVKNTQGLYVITAGEYDADPVSLLSHERMSYLTTQGATIFDYVIIDAPPVVGFADALVLSSLSSATLLVAQESSLDAGTVQHVLKQLGRVKNNVLGFLLVNVKKQKTDAKFYKKYHSKSAKQALLTNKAKYA